jgi:propionyl-CoA synthetase
MEEVLASHPDVAEAAVIGASDDLKGEVPVGLVVLKTGVQHTHDEVKADLIKLIREKIGPVASFKKVAVVDRLPKTRSGKVLRGVMRNIADAKPYRTPATIDDPGILAEIGDALKDIGYGEK